MSHPRPIPPPRRAVVLAAGFGTRLAPLTHTLPKALIPLWGASMLEHALRLLQSWGVREVLLNCHAHAGQVLETARTLPIKPLRVTLSFEPDILGTGGALHHAAWFLDDKPFWLLNADVAADLDPTPLLQHPPTGRTIATLWMEPGLGPRSVRLARGRVVSFRDKNPGTPGTATLCGLHLLSPRILASIPAGFSTIVQAYELAMKEGCRIRAITIPNAYWADVGTPGQYLEAHADIAERFRRGAPGTRLMNPAMQYRRRGVTVRGFAAVDPSAHVAPGAILENTVVWPLAQIGPHANLRNAVVASKTTINHPARRLVMPAAQALPLPVADAVQHLHWPLSETTAECLPPRPGSMRSFTRLHSAGHTCMVVRYNPERSENRLYAPLARFLHHAGIRVPTVLYDNPAQHFTIFEDLGNDSLESLTRHADPNTARDWYAQILQQIAHLHGPVTHTARRSHIRLMEPFTPALFHHEHILFTTYALNPTPNLPPTLRNAVLADLRHVARQLLQQPQVLLHRDLQSSNIFRVRNQWAWIDFQGMRYGPAPYDLASLLCDPYVSLPLSTQLDLLATIPTSSITSFWFAAVQRLTQALGAYGRLATLPGNQHFQRYIPPALHMLQRAVHLANTPLPALQHWLNLSRIT
jgi:NDP-sugar pyrophosphorylase family protein/aminoglycoside/choline kinase family phosphotransferase